MPRTLQMHKRSFQVPKNHNFAPKIFGIWLNGHCFLGHYQDAVSLLLSIQHTIIHLNNWTLLFIFISFLISHVTNPLHLRARSVLFVSKKGWSHTPAPSLILPQIKENCTVGQPESFLLQSQRVETDIISLLWNSTGNPYCGKIWRKNTLCLSTQERCSCNLSG